MTNLESLETEFQKRHPDKDAQIIRDAYHFSEKAHSGQLRRSGEPYFTHPVEVAKILARLGMDQETVTTGLLHDVVEDTLASVENVRQKFGPQVADLVDGVTKLSKVSFSSKDVRQAESFRKMLLAMAQDIRVIIVKLADRLHNMRTLEHMDARRQAGIAQETLDIYAPLANRLGISWMKIELEDLAFQYLRPAIFEKLKKLVDDTAHERDLYIARVIDIIGGLLRDQKIECNITGRRKHLYSIFKKMETRNLEFEQIADLLAFRIIVNDISHCYEVLGHIHSKWKPVPGRFKDYIALPKANMYQSLHTTVIGPDGKRIEVQIRTDQMHRTAEEGIAAHWIYKSPPMAGEKDVDRFGWLRQMVEWQHDLKDAHEFIETVKIDLFAGEVYVFTPNGDVHEFPRGATPIDFAYRIHTEIGHRCQGARVNGRLVPLKYKLQNGDTIEIMTSQQARPSKDWLKIAVTSKAKSKIRGVLKTEQRQTGRTVGREILERELKRFNASVDDLIKSGKLKSVARDMEYDSVDSLFLALGYGKLSPADLLELLLPADRHRSAADQAALKQIGGKGSPKRSNVITVGGIDDVMVRYGKCCDPLPGDPILGFVTRGRGVTIHRTDCYKVLEVDDERKVETDWSKKSQPVRNVKIRVISQDVPGILANISRVISLKGANISHASIKTTQDKKAINTFNVDITDAEQLESVIRSIEQLQGIISVERVRA